MDFYDIYIFFVLWIKDNFFFQIEIVLFGMNEWFLKIKTNNFFWFGLVANSYLSLHNRSIQQHIVWEKYLIIYKTSFFLFNCYQVLEQTDWV